MKKPLVTLTILLSIVLIAILGYSSRTSIRNTISATVAHIGGHYEPFPEQIDNGLSNTQRSVLKIVKAEYEKRPKSYDRTVLVYTDGNKEAWCADFASWVMKEVGAPYVNPNSNNWRIPGVLTLQAYYQQQDRYVSAGTSQPAVGDVAFYIRDGRLFARQHVAIVVGVEGDTMTTLSGNDGGKMLLRRQNTISGDDLVGFGKLSKAKE